MADSVAPIPRIAANYIVIAYVAVLILLLSTILPMVFASKVTTADQESKIFFGCIATGIAVYLTLLIWVQSRTRISESGVFYGKFGGSAHIPWKDTTAWWEGAAFVVRSESQKVRINSMIFENRSTFLNYVNYQFPGVNTPRAKKSKPAINRNHTHGE